MFKVLIIDDEPMVRKGLVKVVKWEKMGCQVIGEASNGKEGMEMIKTFHPEIIITDINMPEVDGLQMIRETLSESEKSKIIILTGYRDFDYIHEALQLGAFEYLLKPSKLDEIIKVVNQAVTELKYLDQAEETKAIWQSKYKKAIPILKEKLFKDIISRVEILDDERKMELEALGVQLELYYVMLFEIDSPKDIHERQMNKFGVINTFEELMSDEYTFQKVDIGNNRVMFVVSVDHKDELIPISQLLEEMIEICAKCFDLSVTVAISSLGERIDVLARMAQEALTAIDHSFYLGKETLILFDDLRIVSYADINELEPLALQMMKAIKLGDLEGTREVIHQIEIVATENKAYHHVEMESFLVRCIYDIYNYVLIDGHGEGTFDEIDPVALHNEIQGAIQYTDFLNILKRIAFQIASDSNHLKRANISHIIQDAVQYIREHFQDSITLNDISEHVNISTYYLSRMFKKEMGKNISEYLVELRIEQAKVLLKTSDHKLYEIADEVGIPDPHYFSRLFKKHLGISPSQYREG